MGFLLRYQVFLTYGALFVAVWRAALQQEEQLVETAAPYTTLASLLIRFAPLWGIASLGVYALVTIVYNVLTFEDCPEAAKEIDDQVKEARAELKKRGIPVNS